MPKDPEACFRAITNRAARRATSECAQFSAQFSHKRLISRELLHRTLSRNASSCDQFGVFATVFR
jgi:hypothetical protein